MGRPQTHLKDWCLEDYLLKAEFLKRESESPRGLIIRTDQGYVPNFNIYPQFQANNFSAVVLSNGITIHVSQSCYDKLKAKFRTFKKKNKDRNKVKKQYSLDKETAKFLSDFKEKYNYAREENVIEHLVKKHEKQALDSEHLNKLDKSFIRVQHLKSELAEYKEVCSKNKNDKVFLKAHISELDNLLAKAYLLNEFFKKTLKEHAIEYYPPSINDDDVERYKAEIRNNLRSY